MAIKEIDGVKVFYISAADKKALKKRAFPAERVKTINYHGSKKAWIEEFEVIYDYVCKNYDVNILADCFGGSGFLSLLAAKSELFKKIHLNEIEYSAINYHFVMKDDALFSKFIYYLYKIDKDMFDLMTNRIKFVADGTGGYKKVKVKQKKEKYKRIQVRKPSVRKAVNIFTIRHYAFRGNGAYVKQSKDPQHYREDLKETHELYQQIDLTQFYYKRVMKSYLNDSHALIMLDPPYLDRTIIKKNPYVCNFTVRQHRYLLQKLTEKKHEAKILLCGYDDKMYNHYFELFNRRNNSVVWHNVRILRLGKRKNNPRHEHIWTNFEIDDLVNKYPNLFELIY